MLAAVSVVVRGISWFYPVMPVLLFVGIFAAGRELYSSDLLKVLYLMLPFGVWAALTSLWSFYPVVSITRGAYYFYLVTGLTAMVYHLKKQGISFFELLLPVNSLIVLVSFFSLLTGIPDDGWTAGNAKGFMGLFAHQNTLGAILLFTFPGWMYLHWKGQQKSLPFEWAKVLSSLKNPESGWLKKVWVVGALLNIVLLTLTHSRASILSLFVMLALYSFMLYRKNVKGLVVSSLLLVLTFVSVSVIDPVSVKNSLSGSFEKDASGIQEEKLLPPQNNESWFSFWYKGDDTPYSTRQHIFSDSWKAAQLGGLFGIGYGVSHPDIKNNAAGSRFDENGRYIREKGNSFLALVEETGVIGFVLYLLPLSVVLLIIKRLKKSVFQSVMILPAFTSIFFHAQFEGWMTGVTSIFLFILSVFLVSSISNRLNDRFHKKLAGQIIE